MESNVSLEIENFTDFDFSVESAEEAIRKVLVSQRLAGNFEVGLKLVSKEEIHKLNFAYRKKDEPTDVLSFPISDKVESGKSAPVLLGDIVICPEVMRKNALEFSVSDQEEFKNLIEHSTLHLLGIHHPGD